MVSHSSGVSAYPTQFGGRPKFDPLVTQEKKGSISQLFSDGAKDTDGSIEREGATDGRVVGVTDGTGLGAKEGTTDGKGLGAKEGTSDGALDQDGAELGYCEGASLGQPMHSSRLESQIGASPMALKDGMTFSSGLGPISYSVLAHDVTLLPSVMSIPGVVL